VVKGTYARGGMEGNQQWTITMDAAGSAGSFTYKDKAKGRPGGSPVVIVVDARSVGTATMAIDATGRAQMRLTETSRDSRARAVGTPGVGWSSTTVGTYDLTWEVGGAC
jgi:hypothetical protein